LIVLGTLFLLKKNRDTRNKQAPGALPPTMTQPGNHSSMMPPQPPAQSVTPASHMSVYGAPPGGYDPTKMGPQQGYLPPDRGETISPMSQYNRMSNVPQPMSPGSAIPPPGGPYQPMPAPNGVPPNVHEAGGNVVVPMPHELNTNHPPTVHELA
jgi:hypothetical protein